MTAQLIDGKNLALHTRKEIQHLLCAREAKGFRKPGLAVILIGNHPASQVYVNHKHRACVEVGILSTNHCLPEETSETVLLSLIDALNNNPSIDGILVQLPLPLHINPEAIIERIRPDKDVDGFHPYNLGRLAQRRPFLRPCTPYGVVKLLESLNQPLRSQSCTIVGASNIVGRPMALEMLMLGCTTTVCHKYTHTEDLKKQIAHADILISAVGQPGIIRGEWIKEGAIVIDIGITRLDNGTLIGDVDFASAQKRAGWITPVPGGVGPMTVAMLLHNTVVANTLHEESF